MSHKTWIYDSGLLPLLPRKITVNNNLCWLLMFQALNGFLMMATQTGKLLYISDNAAEYLGHSMVTNLT